jgi:prepilin-type N-terminal cleavage/methylation domain-containing protein
MKEMHQTAKLHNKGYTLVEVLVAVAVASMVASSVAGLIFTALNLFGRANAAVEVQNDIQATTNVTLDNIMGAEGITLFLPADVLAPGDPPASTPIVMLGDLMVVTTTSGDDTICRLAFSGKALIFDETVTSLYLVDLTQYYTASSTIVASAPSYRYLPGQPTGGYVDEDPQIARQTALNALPDLLTSLRSAFIAPANAQKLNYILGVHVNLFRVVPAITPANALFDDPATTPLAGQVHQDGMLGMERINFVNGFENQYYFREPFNLRVTISSTYRTGGDGRNTVDRIITNETAIRSRINTVYIAEPVDPSSGLTISGRPNITTEYKRR